MAERCSTGSASALADELMAFHDCCTQDAGGGDGSFRVECSSGSDAQARALRAVLRGAADALRSLDAAEDDIKLAYVKRWRTIVKLPAKYADEIVEALRSTAQASLPPIVDRNELIALLEDLASVNLSREAVERQARRMADDLIARGLTFATPQPASTPANFVTIPTNLAQRLRDHLQQADSFVWLDEIQMLDAALPSTPRGAPHD